MTKNKEKKKNIIRKSRKERKSLNFSKVMPNVRVPASVTGNLRTFLDGSFLTREKFIKQAPFFFYVLGFAFVYIALNFYADKTLLTIERTKEEIKELRFEFVTVSSELIQFTQASNVKNILAEDGLKRPVTPPVKIFVNVNSKGKKNHDSKK